MTCRRASVPRGAYVRLEVARQRRRDGRGDARARIRAVFHDQGVGDGSGLGLATVYGIVQQSGGHVWVDSAPNRGAAFLLLFPEVSDTGHGG